MTRPLLRTLDENLFLKQNWEKFIQLTRREKEVLRHIVIGKSTKEIGDYLFVTRNTVNFHKRNIRSKLGIKSYFEHVKYAYAFDMI